MNSIIRWILVAFGHVLGCMDSMGKMKCLQFYRIYYLWFKGLLLSAMYDTIYVIDMMNIHMYISFRIVYFHPLTIYFTAMMIGDWNCPNWISVWINSAPHFFVFGKFSVGPAGTCPSGPIQYSGHLSWWYLEVVRFKVRKTVIMWLMLLMCGMKKSLLKV